jgi:hypothetical protein
VPTRQAAAAPPPLTDDDVASLREKVKAGEKPRVVIRAASAAVAAGTRGNVIKVGNPKEGEYIVVRLGKDEVPFAPNELGIPGRKAAAVPSRPVAKRPVAKKAAAKRPAPSKRVPPLIVTMRFRDSSWTVEAQRGARRLARPTALRPGAVSALADHLDDEALREALVEAVESCRSVVEAQRAELREKLEAAEAALRDYDARPRRR